MSRDMRREQTRERLLAATEALIREKGCAQLTLRDIMEVTGLSKGGIFHHVKSKDELLGRVLKERLEALNRRFSEAAERERSFEAPLREIAAGLPLLTDPDDAANRVYMYLLGKSSQPEVREVLLRFYEQVRRISEEWIAAGQKAGVIPDAVNAGKTADLFVLISMGLRMRSLLSPQYDDRMFDAEDYASFIASRLQS